MRQETQDKGDMVGQRGHMQFGKKMGVRWVQEGTHQVLVALCDGCTCREFEDSDSRLTNVV